MKSNFLTFSIIIVILFSFSCKKEEKNGISTHIISLKYGNSFGECMGYCRNEMDIAQTSVIIKSSSWDKVNYPDKLCQKSITTGKWNEIVRCADSISFNSLDSIYGCPDCADGGAEWVEIATSGWKHKVTVDYSGPNRPVVLENLFGKLRGLKNAILGCN
jgi:hypothetical protein